MHQGQKEALCLRKIPNSQQVISIFNGNKLNRQLYIGHIVNKLKNEIKRYYMNTFLAVYIKFSILLIIIYLWLH